MNMYWYGTMVWYHQYCCYPMGSSVLSIYLKFVWQREEEIIEVQTINHVRTYVHTNIVVLCINQS